MSNRAHAPLDLSLLPPVPLYGDASLTAGIGWQLSPTPFVLSTAQFEQLTLLGELLQRFLQAIDLLYRQSRNPNLPIPEWIANLYDQGKPESLVQYSGMKRFKSHLPVVLRPDLLLHDDGWTLCEIDAVPGGLGFTAALNQFYKQHDFPVIESEVGLPNAFLNLLKAQVPDLENPVIAVVISSEAADYQPEMQWLVDTLRSGSSGNEAYPFIFIVTPQSLDLVRDQLVFTDSATGQIHSVDLIYRFFELFDLPNIPKIELIQYAVKKGFARCTPPFKPHVEEKLSLALLHHPALKAFWQKELTPEGHYQLTQWVPPGWIVDPAPIPPQATIPGLTPGGKPIQHFGELKVLSQKERELVLKPSGFSELGWGSRGVTIGHDHSAEEWAAQLDTAMAHFEKTPYILQQFIPAGAQQLERLNLTTGETQLFKARTRLCPYYFVQDGKVSLAGVLATSCPADKKIIHGMKDAVLAPCMIEQVE